MAFPQYLGIFSKITIHTSLTLLEKYTSPNAFLKADINKRLLMLSELQHVLDLHMLKRSIMPLFRLLTMPMNLVTSLTVISGVFVFT